MQIKISILAISQILLVLVIFSNRVFCNEKFYAVGWTQILDENKDEGQPLQSQNFADLLGVPEVGFSNGRKEGDRHARDDNRVKGLLASWNPSSSKADFVVAQDDSGNFKTINEAVRAVAKIGQNNLSRVIIYVKSGLYREKVEIPENINSLMVVGDGIDRTVVSWNDNWANGTSTYGTATFAVAANGFWARDISFENTAGPEKHQAVALRVNADRAIFHKCSMKGYQDTLYAHSGRQFYRDCKIYGTIDFIFGDAAAVFQNCDIYVRKPLQGQSNVITAQQRESDRESTGFAIQKSRILPAPDFFHAKRTVKSYFGRPWGAYSRTAVIETHIDGLIDPSGWLQWEGKSDSVLSTLYYAEYGNSGEGSPVQNRVRWPGFHALRSRSEASPFSASNLIQGDTWIPHSGIPFLADI